MVKNIDKLFSKIIILLLITLCITFIENEFKKKYNNNSNNDILEIYFFDVGQADSTLIRSLNYTLLIDGGNVSDGINLVNYLKEELSINKIDVVIGTHPHEDHIGGLSDIVNSFNIDKIYMPDVISTSKPFNDLLESIKDKDLSITIPKINDTFSLGDIKYKIIHVDNNEDNLNDSSIVLKLEYYNNTFLFMADASKSVEKKIINSDIFADVIKIGHHGSSYSSSDKFIDKVNPTYAVISVGDNNYKHPNSKVLKMLEKKDIKVLRTDLNGTIKLVSDGNTIKYDFLETKIDG